MTFNFKSFSPFCLLCTARMYGIPLIIKKSPFKKHIQNVNIYKLVTFFYMLPNIIFHVYVSDFILFRRNVHCVCSVL